MTTTTCQTLFAITNPHFAHGYRLGRLWYFSSFDERVGEIDDRYLIENIATYAEKGWHKDPDWLSERVGFLMGMVSGAVIPE